MNQIQDCALTLMFSISLKTRILRAWQAANRAADQDFSERELLSLELIEDFAPITEKGICKIFGISFSTASDMLDRLANEGLLEQLESRRGKALKLTSLGRTRLEELKHQSATRFGYLFEGVNDSDWETLTRIFSLADTNATRWVSRLVFDRSSTAAVSEPASGEN